MRNCAKDIKLTTLNNFCSKKRKHKTKKIIAKRLREAHFVIWCAPASRCLPYSSNRSLTLL